MNLLERTWSTYDVGALCGRHRSTNLARLFPAPLPANGSGRPHRHGIEAVASAVIFEALRLPKAEHGTGTRPEWHRALALELAGDPALWTSWVVAWPSSWLAVQPGDGAAIGRALDRKSSRGDHVAVLLDLPAILAPMLPEGPS